MEKLPGIVFTVKKHIKLDFFTVATAKRAIFGTDILRESCSEFGFEQLSHSMSVPNMAHFAVAMVALFFVFSMGGGVRYGSCK